MKKKWIMILTGVLLISILLTVFLINRPKEIDNDMLFSAIAEGDLASVSAMIGQGQDVNVMNEEGMSAFQSAVIYVQPEIASLLLAEGANLSDGDAWLAAGAMIDPTIDEHDVNARIRELLQIIHNQDADLVHEVNDQEETLLFEALRMQDSELFNWLTEKKVDSGAINSSGDTLYHTAARFPFNSVSFIVESITYSGGKVNGNSDTPMMIAVKANQPDWIREFAKTDDINWQNENGWTPLMFAVDYGFVESAEMLIQLGADIQSENSSGETAEDIAGKYYNRGIISLLSQN